MPIKSHPFTLGVDIEDIGRFSTKPYHHNQSFYQKIFSDQEIKYCLGKKNPYPHFAVRFCAKEAFIKATSTKLVSSPLIEVVMKDNKPFVVHNKIQYTASLSHERDKAIAVVILWVSSLPF